MGKSWSVLLSWPGRTGPEAAVPEVELERVAGDDSAIRIVHGDNEGVLQAMAPELEGKVSLVYLDPPFFTMREFERVTRRKSGTSPPVRILTPAFDDRWCGLESYLSSLRSRLVLLRKLLSPHGSVVVHVDPRTSHYVKVLGDEIFGPDAFASEIVWRYRRWPARTPNFQRVHDVLLRWVADPCAAPRFTQLYEELAPSTLKTWGRGKQKAVFDGTGRRRRSSTEQAPSPGVPLGDVWEISIIAPVGRERTGYPTQKPEGLLERVIGALSEPGDIVLDPYMGSGTTLSVAAKLGRRAVGMDQSHVAVGVTRERLAAAGVQFSEFRAVPVQRQQAPGQLRRHAP
ncbi:MAG: site-specific DNA-methyltransferase [Deltaproteobacteria bacterium]|nr:site-specific DNA-methyltransferase [Deltaproteobacteria bacterium]